jgi:hypothetical protein
VKAFHVPRRHGGSGCANLVVKFLDLTSLVFGFTVARERQKGSSSNDDSTRITT